MNKRASRRAKTSAKEADNEEILVIQAEAKSPRTLRPHADRRADCVCEVLLAITAHPSRFGRVSRRIFEVHFLLCCNVLHECLVAEIFFQPGDAADRFRRAPRRRRPESVGAARIAPFGPSSFKPDQLSVELGGTLLGLSLRLVAANILQRSQLTGAKPRRLFKVIL